MRDFVEKLPREVSREYYRSLLKTSPNPITSWIRFECSFAAKFENGYASNREGRNYAEKGVNLAVKQSPLLQGVCLEVSCYKNLTFENSVIYCDPPYQNTTGYKQVKFDHNEFFEWCRLQAKNNNLVFVSEYIAPEDFLEIWSGEVKTTFASHRLAATRNATEKLFLVKG